MAKVFSLSAIRAYDLMIIIGGLTPKEIAEVKKDESVKAISRVQRIYEEIEKANESFVKLSEKFNEPIEKLREEYQKEITKIRSDDSIIDKDKAINTFLGDANFKLQQVIKEQDKKLNYSEAGAKMISVIVGSDERFALLKDIFEKIAPEKYLVKKALCETFEALEEAREA